MHVLAEPDSECQWLLNSSSQMIVSVKLYLKLVNKNFEMDLLRTRSPLEPPVACGKLALRMSGTGSFGAL